MTKGKMIYCDSQFMYAESGIFHSNRDEEHLSRLPYSNDGEMMAQQPVLCTVSTHLQPGLLL